MHLQTHQVVTRFLCWEINLNRYLSTPMPSRWVPVGSEIVLERKTYVFADKWLSTLFGESYRVDTFHTLLLL